MMKMLLAGQWVNRDQTIDVRWCSRFRRPPQTTVLEYLVDDFSLGRLDKTDDRHLAAATRTGARVNFVNPLDKHGPCLATAGWRCGGSVVSTGWLGSFFGCRFLAHTVGFVRVVATIADRMRAFGRNVLGEFG